jgi:DNA-binding transcriptional LysR family regulator
MDLGHLDVFICVAHEKSFSRAAQKLFRTQPAVSLSIKRLEEDLGVTLFDRSSKGGTLTEAGRALLIYAQQMSNLREEAAEALKDLKGHHRGRLTLGANESTSLYLLPPLLLEFHAKHPNLKIELHRNLSEHIPSEVLERNLDFGFLSYDPMLPSLHVIELYRDHLTLVVGPSHSLAKRRQVKIEDLGETNFIAHNARTPARSKIVEFFAKQGVPLNISMDLSTLETIKDFVAQGVGAAILPRLALTQELASGRLIEVPVKDLFIEKTLRLVHRRGAPLSHAAQAFLDLVLNSVKKPARKGA